jgi:aspartate racemase
MQSRFYGGVTIAAVITPSDEALNGVHDAYTAMATTGAVTPEQRYIFETAARSMMDDDGAKAILLGGTDLALAFDAKPSVFPLIACAAIHAQAIALYANSAIR